jgi:hypothetical protein
VEVQEKAENHELNRASKEGEEVVSSLLLLGGEAAFTGADGFFVW